MSQYFEVHPENPQLRLLKQAVQILHGGGIAAIPTDSSYALVCHLDDKAADVDDVSRNTYIQSEYDEETAGTVEAIQHAKERRADLGYAQYTESERRYDEGYDRGYNEALERGRSPQLAHQAGESAGREAVRERFSSGDSRSSDGGQTYGERAGETWDAENDWNPFNGI